MKRAIDGRVVRCEYDQRGRYGRLIGTCYLGDANVNAWMVAQGQALAYRRYNRAYVPLERKAEEERRGMWRGKFVAPWDWRQGERLDR